MVVPSEGLVGTGGLGNIAGAMPSEHHTEGARAEGASRIAQLLARRMTIQNNMTEVIAENGSDIRIATAATITDNGTDMVLIFGSLGCLDRPTRAHDALEGTDMSQISNQQLAEARLFGNPYDG
jgi:hypothetical protein